MFQHPLTLEPSDHLQELLRYQILDSEYEEIYDEITSLAAELGQTKFACFCMSDGKKIWFKSHYGLDFREIPVQHAFQSIHSTAFEWVGDTMNLEKFSTNPLVVGSPFIRFFASTPVINERGFLLGHLIILDDKPRSKEKTERSILHTLGRQIQFLLEFRKKYLSTKETIILESKQDSFFDLGFDLCCVMNHSGIFTQRNQVWKSKLAYEADHILGLGNFLVDSLSKEVLDRCAGIKEDEILEFQSKCIAFDGRILDSNWKVKKVNQHFCACIRVEEKVESLVQTDMYDVFEAYGFPFSSWTYLYGKVDVFRKNTSFSVFFQSLSVQDQEAVRDFIEKKFLTNTAGSNFQEKLYLSHQTCWNCTGYWKREESDLHLETCWNNETEWFQRTKAIEAQLNRFKLSDEISRSGTFIYYVQTAAFYLSAHLSKQLGFDTEYIHLNDFLELFSQKDQRIFFTEQMFKVVGLGEKSKLEVYLDSKGGENLHVEIELSTQTDEDNLLCLSGSIQVIPVQQERTDAIYKKAESKILELSNLVPFLLVNTDLQVIQLGRNMGFHMGDKVQFSYIEKNRVRLSKAQEDCIAEVEVIGEGNQLLYLFKIIEEQNLVSGLHSSLNLEDVLSRMEIGVFELNMEKDLFHCTQVCKDLLGIHKSSNVQVKDFICSFTEESSSILSQQLIQTVEKGKGFQQSLVLKLDQKFVDIEVQPVFDSGICVYVSGTITESKNISQSSVNDRKSKDDITGSWEWNVIDGDIQVDQKWANILGYQMAELGQLNLITWLEFRQPDQLSTVQNLIESHLRGQSEYYESECLLLHKNGTWTKVYEYGKIVSWTESGLPELMIGTIQIID